MRDHPGACIISKGVKIVRVFSTLHKEVVIKQQKDKQFVFSSGVGWAINEPL
jgi:uncharacterized lipoprotein YmbA